METANEGTQDLRDYRITNSTTILNQFVSDLDALGTRYSWANSRAVPTSVSSPGAPPPPTSLPTSGGGGNSTGSQGPEGVIITATTRPRSTEFPSLFGSKSDGGGGQREEILELTVVVMSALMGGWVVLRNL